MSARTARRAGDLVAAGVVPPERAAEIERVAERFALAVTPALLEPMSAEDPDDPLALQFIPTLHELEVSPGERADPIGDERCSPVRGVIHRYPDRVLLTPVFVCPVYCRFCFRREKVGPGSEALTVTELETALDYIRSRPEIWEVILTGGDPLVLSPRRLGAIVGALAAIDHVEVIRVHTRVPVAAPERVTPELVRALSGPKPVWVVLHANHPRELSEAARAACARLVDGGLPMLAQTVLLAGINDDPRTLETLLRELVKLRIKPYYLHQLDFARGTGHFRVPLGRGQELMRGLRGRVSGLCQPTYVLDVPGGHGKVPVGPGYLQQTAPGRFEVEDPDGGLHPYPPETGFPPARDRLR